MAAENETLLSLLEGHLEGRLAASERVELREMLLASREARRLFWKFLSQDALLAELGAETLGARSIPSAGVAGVADPELQTIPFPRRFKAARVAIYAMAASIALAAGGYFFFQVSGRSSSVALLEKPAGVVIERDNGVALPGETSLKAGDVVKTPANASLVLGYRDGSRVEVRGGSRLTYQSLEDSAPKSAASKGKVLFLQEGRITASVAKQKEPMVIRTHQAEATVLGTKFNLISEANNTRLEVLEGAVSFRKLGEQKAVIVRAGDSATTSEPDGLGWMSSLPATGSVEKPALLLKVGASKASISDPGVRVAMGHISAHEGDQYVATREDDVVVARWGLSQWKASFRFYLDSSVPAGDYYFAARWMQGGDPKVSRQKFEVWAGADDNTLERRAAVPLDYKQGWTFAWAGGARVELKEGDAVIEVRNSGPGHDAKVFQAFLLSPTKPDDL